MRFVTNSLPQNTSDPEALRNPIEEGPGAIASDSLAAESVNAGGAFSENRNSEPLAQSGSKSTFNNTDTSGATELGPTPDAAEREAKEAWQATSDEVKGPGGVKYPEGADQAIGEQGESGVYQASGIRGGGPGADDSREDYTPGGSGGNPDSSDTNTAPSYVNSVQSQPAQSGKPKGKNITEGGFDSDDSNNASFTAEVGSKDDPAQRAANEMQMKTQSASGPTGPRQKMGEGDNSQYDVLQEEQNL